MSVAVGTKPEIEVDERLAREHGLSDAEWDRLLGFLGRTPTLTELGITSALWSEHCSYKTSKIYLREFPTSGPRVLQGPGENAGVVDIGHGWVAVFKMESHNHPSFIAPYQGAATGVGGILRDIFTMGARPIAGLDSLHFGALDAPRMRSLVDGVVRGIGDYGNCVGIPTVGGETRFHPSYNQNILVNAFALGVARRDRIFRAKAQGVGNPILYAGSRTGRDGIHGAAMLLHPCRPVFVAPVPVTRGVDRCAQRATHRRLRQPVVCGRDGVFAASFQSISANRSWPNKTPMRRPSSGSLLTATAITRSN
jgi:phosphoribosylformylglycinamidine synthase